MGCGRSIYFLQRLLHSKLFSVNFDRGIHKSTDNKQVSRTKVSLVVKKWRSLYLLSSTYTRILPRFFFFSRKKTSLKRLVHGLFSSRMRMVQLLPLFFQAPGFSEIQTCPKLLIRYTLGTNGSV